MSLRVTGGEFAGRRLRTPKSGVRPSAGRVRESLFARLGDVSGAAVLDLFAGTGVLGIESLSRGAASLVSVEHSKATAGVLRANVAALGLDSVARVMIGDAAKVVARLGRTRERFDLVLLDPPYAAGLAETALAALVRAAVLEPGARVVLERGRSHPVGPVAGLAWVDDRRYGDTVITRFAVAEAGAGLADVGDGEVESA